MTCFSSRSLFILVVCTCIRTHMHTQNKGPFENFQSCIYWNKGKRFCSNIALTNWRGKSTSGRLDMVVSTINIIIARNEDKSWWKWKKKKKGQKVQYFRKDFQPYKSRTDAFLYSRSPQSMKLKGCSTIWIFIFH